LDHVDDKFFRENFNFNGKMIDFGDPVKHAYTHFKLHLYPVIVKSEKRKFKSEFYVNHRWSRLENIFELPLHKAMLKLLEKIIPQLEIVTN
jgi:hypothetical protein